MLLGMKPFWQHRSSEFYLHLGFANTWLAMEWFEAPDEGYRESMIEEFRAFSDTEIDKNSIDFIYWINGSGMSELIHAFNEQGISKSAFLREMKQN